MVFKVIKPYLNDTGKIYNAPIVKKYINAYDVLAENGDRCTLMKCDIEVISMTDEEKAMLLEF